MNHTHVPTGDGSTVEDAYLSRERDHVVREVIESLPAVEAAIIKPLYYDELSLSVIAQALDCDKSWACRLHHRAMARLAARIKLAMR